MSLLSDPEFWSLVDRRIQRGLQRAARPVRALIAGLDASKRLGVVNLQARADEDVPDVELAQHYGLCSAPPAGTEVVAVPVGGSSSHLVAVAELDRGSRPTDVAAGATCLYDSAGTRVDLLADGSLRISTPTGERIDVGPAGIVHSRGGTPQRHMLGDAYITDFNTWSTAFTAFLAACAADAAMSPGVAAGAVAMHAAHATFAASLAASAAPAPAGAPYLSNLSATE